MNDAIIGTLIAIGCGVLCAGLGGYMVATGNPSLLHGYHYATTPLAERPALARESGTGLIITGVGCALMGLSDTLGIVVSVAGITLLVAGIAVALAAIIRHNGSLISFAPAPPEALPGNASRVRRSTIQGAALGVVLSLVGIAPGVYMIATGDVSMLHSYHYATIAAADLPAFSVAEGLSMVGLGIGLLLCCLAGGRMTARPIPRWAKVVMALGGVVWCASLAAMLIAIVSFGGSLS